jgi:hypothetical protein
MTRFDMSRRLIPSRVLEGLGRGLTPAPSVVAVAGKDSVRGGRPLAGVFCGEEVTK